MLKKWRSKIRILVKNEQHIHNNRANFPMETLEMLSMFMDKKCVYDYCADSHRLVSNSCEQCHHKRCTNQLSNHYRGKNSMAFFLPFITLSYIKYRWILFFHTKISLNTLKLLCAVLTSNGCLRMIIPSSCLHCKP